MLWLSYTHPGHSGKPALLPGEHATFYSLYRNTVLIKPEYNCFKHLSFGVVLISLLADYKQA
jgi:hypothetical protein